MDFYGLGLISANPPAYLVEMISVVMLRYTDLSGDSALKVLLSAKPGKAGILV